MYLEHYGLARKPFSKTPDPEFLFPSRQHAEALARLSHAVEEREVAVLTGEVGAGKTTLSRALVDAFAERCRFSFVVNPALPPAQLLGAIAEGFGLRTTRRKADAFSALAEHVARLDAEGRFAVVVVDEAQLLPGRAAYDELRLLTNLAADDRALVGIVLVGQPELRARLRERGGEAFTQRVGVAYHVGALDAEETGLYLAHRLAVAGRAAPLFDAGAVAALHRHAGGLPRRINQLAASALLEGFAREVTTISVDVVEAAAEDLAAHLGTPARAR
jgi:type II secretory pathway predicted ATPase ExeA